MNDVLFFFCRKNSRKRKWCTASVTRGRKWTVKIRISFDIEWGKKTFAHTIKMMCTVCGMGEFQFSMELNNAIWNCIEHKPFPNRTTQSNIFCLFAVQTTTADEWRRAKYKDVYIYTGRFGFVFKWMRKQLANENRTIEIETEHHFHFYPLVIGWVNPISNCN